MEEIVGFPISVLTSESASGFKQLTTGLHQVQAATALSDSQTKPTISRAQAARRST
jgi:hypothetical protein